MSNVIRKILLDDKDKKEFIEFKNRKISIVDLPLKLAFLLSEQINDFYVLEQKLLNKKKKF